MAYRYQQIKQLNDTYTHTHTHTHSDEDNNNNNKRLRCQRMLPAARCHHGRTFDRTAAPIGYISVDRCCDRLNIGDPPLGLFGGATGKASSFPPGDFSTVKYFITHSRRKFFFDNNRSGDCNLSNNNVEDFTEGNSSVDD